MLAADPLRSVRTRFEEMLLLVAAQHEQDVSLLRRKLVEMQEQLHALGHSFDEDTSLMIGSQDLLKRAKTLSETAAPPRARRPSLQNSVQRKSALLIGGEQAEATHFGSLAAEEAAARPKRHSHCSSERHSQQRKSALPACSDRVEAIFLASDEAAARPKRKSGLATCSKQVEYSHSASEEAAARPKRKLSLQGKGGERNEAGHLASAESLPGRAVLPIGAIKPPEGEAVHLPSVVAEEASKSSQEPEDPHKVQLVAAPSVPKEVEASEQSAGQSDSEDGGNKDEDEEVDIIQSLDAAKREHKGFRASIQSEVDIADLPEVKTEKKAEVEQQQRVQKLRRMSTAGGRLQGSLEALSKDAILKDLRAGQERVVRRTARALSGKTKPVPAAGPQSFFSDADRQASVESDEPEKEEPAESAEKKLEDFQKGAMSQRRVALPLDFDAPDAETIPKIERHDLLGQWCVPQAFLKIPQQSRKSTSISKNTRGNNFRLTGPANGASAEGGLSLGGVLINMKHFLGGDPNSSRHFWWDVASLWLFILDLVFVPLLVSFELLGQGVEVIMCLTTLFRTIDVVRCFLVGYRVRGEVVMDSTKVAIHYLKTFCFLDISICLIDWIWIAGVPTQSFMLLARLLRLPKVTPVVRVIEERSENDMISTSVRISRHLVTIFILCHWIACIWWSLGQNITPSWILFLPDWYENSVIENYALSLHWALSQFTPAPATPANPRNLVERVFNIVTILAAMIIFSISFSGITGALADLRANSSAKARQYWILRKFLSKSGVPREIAVRAQENFNYSWDVRKSPMLESNVQALDLLSPALKEELRMSIFMPSMFHHPLMAIFHKAATLTMQHICGKAMKPLLLAGGDMVFHPGQVSKGMFFVRNGNATYEIVLDNEGTSSVCMDSTSSESDEDEESKESDSDDSSEESSIEGELHSEHLVAKDWIGEPALWTVWIHLGGFQATQQCELVALDSEQFQELVRTNAPCQAEACLYARRYVDELNEAVADKYSDTFRCQELHVSRLLPDTDMANFVKDTLTPIMRRTSTKKFLGVMG